MKLPPWWRKALGGILVFLVILNPISLPLAIFIGLLLFSTSDKGKEFFDTDRWHKEEKKSKPQKEKPDKKQKEDHSEEEPPKEEKPSLSDNLSHTLSSFTMPANMNFNKKNASGGGLGLFGLLAIVLLTVSVVMDGFVSIPAGHTGVVFSKLSGGVQEETMSPGINFKVPFFDTVTVLDTRIQEETINSNRDPIEALTKDGQKVNIDITVQYRISANNAPRIVQEIGLDYDKKVITPGVRSVVREVITGYDSTELFNQDSRTKAENEIVEQLKGNYEAKFITLEDTLIRDVKFSDKYLDAIEEKKIAEQQIQKSEFEKKNAEVQKEKKIIEAQAEAESIKLKGEALSSSPEVIQLQFVEKMAPSINWGILPDGAVPLIDPASLNGKKE